MSKRKKIWYGLLPLIVIVSSSHTLYAEISRRDWIWTIISAVGLIGVVATCGVIIARAERKKEG